MSVLVVGLAGMSTSSDVDASQFRKKRLKTSADAVSGQDENERPKQCYCFEKSECVVRELRAARRKQFPNVRRRLDFGTEEQDSSQTVPTMSIQFDDHDERSKLQWNFDFKEEVPLPGPWVWVKEDAVVPRKSEGPGDRPTAGVRPKTLKDLFPVSKRNRSKNRSMDTNFRLPLTRLRSTETSPA